MLGRHFGTWPLDLTVPIPHARQVVSPSARVLTVEAEHYGTLLYITVLAVLKLSL